MHGATMKIVHLLGFIIRIYHDARPPERQNLLIGLFLLLTEETKKWHDCNLLLNFNYEAWGYGITHKKKIIIGLFPTAFRKKDTNLSTC